MSLDAVVVVGGGAGGIVAAGRAAETGASVTLFEKMERPGKKLSITGNGRCNVTNSRDLEGFVSMYGPNGRFLYRAFKVFFRDDLIGLLGRYGVGIETEPDGRIFPASGDAGDVIRALEAYLAAGHVRIRTRCSVTEILTDSAGVAGLTVNGEYIPARAVILATGGCSYPGTGSTGDGYDMAVRLGHRIIPVRAALIPLMVMEKEVARGLQGLSLQDVRLSCYRCKADEVEPNMLVESDYGRGFSGKRPNPALVESRRGGLVFTHFGIGGPVTLQASLAVVDALREGPVSVSIDVRPAAVLDEVERELQSQFDVLGRRTVKAVLKDSMAERLAQVVLASARVSGDTRASRVSSEERRRLAFAMKSLRLNVSSALPVAEAMVTAGGISLDEIDPKTMGSKLAPGLFFCGEVLDIDADTGGYNLQAAFSTGYLAGQSAAEFVLSRETKAA